MNKDTIKLSARARISAHTIRDWLSDPPCSAPDEVPWCAEAISPAWLTPILCGQTPHAEVTAVHVEDASAGSSVRKRIAVDYNRVGEDAGLTKAFFAKTTPNVLTRLTSGPSAGQEDKFFRLVRPNLTIETPTHRYSAYDRISGRSLHLFEDLVATHGAEFCDYKTVFTREQIGAALELLASFHGFYYEHAALAKDLAWIPTYEIFFDALAATGTRRGHEQAMDEARSVIPSNVYDAREKLWPAAEAGRATHARSPRTIVHSDVHPGNWYLTRDGQPGLCDWQCISQGHWARDLAYALATMPTVQQRRDWQRELVDRYLIALHKAGGPSVEFADAWEMLGQQLPGALLMWTPTLCHPPTMPDMQPEDVSIEMIHRITRAIDDLGILK